MMPRFKIDLQVDYPGKPDRYYSLRLKQALKNEPVAYAMPKRLFVIADIEGHFQPFCKQLLKRRIIDKYLQWTFGEGHLVILGDCFVDNDTQAAECLWFIYSLEEQARKEGGYVHFILGNHKILTGEWRSSHPRYAEQKTNSRKPITALYNGNTELWHWLQTKNVIEKIGPMLFVHGGIPPAVNSLPHSLAEINDLARANYSDRVSSFSDPAHALLFTAENSPFYYQGYYDGTATSEQVDATLAKFGVHTIITGHTLKPEATPYFDNKVISVNINPESINAEGLFMMRKRIYRITKEGRREKIKKG